MSSWVGPDSDVSASAAWVYVSDGNPEGDSRSLTQWHVVLWLHTDILLDLDIVNAFQNRQAVSDTGYAHFFEIRM